MKKIMVIGSTVLDILIHVEQLPKSNEDIHTLSEKLSLGGCAYNVSNIIHHFHVPYTLFSPVGNGIYGDFVKENLAKRKAHVYPLHPQGNNGCCYCFIEADGERTFVVNRGAEYIFEKEWLDEFDASEYDMVYLCGLELEEVSGPLLVDFIRKSQFEYFFFAPGSRIMHLPQSLLQQCFDLHPLLHLNSEEALAYTQSDSPEEAAIKLNALTQRPVIITLGKKGCLYYDGSITIIPTQPVKQVDTVGAGDSHIGAVMANIAMGKSFEEAIQMANKICSKIVQTNGTQLTEEEFREALLSSTQRKFM